MLLLSPEGSPRHQHKVALCASLATFFSSTFLWLGFDRSTPNFQFNPGLSFIQAPLSSGSAYIGLDGISLFFVILTTFLTPMCLVVSRNAVKAYVKEYMICFLLLELLLLLVFSTLDLVLFYAFFEGTLMPMLIIIGV
jgi:NADH-quinone oxidoreductase subunit M